MTTSQPTPVQPTDLAPNGAPADHSPAPIVGMSTSLTLAASVLAPAAVGALAAGAAALIPQISLPAVWIGAAAPAASLTIVAIAFIRPWSPAPAPKLSIRMFAAQGIAMFLTIFIGGALWFTLKPEPIAAGLTAVIAHKAGVLLQIAVFSKAVTRASRDDQA